MVGIALMIIAAYRSVMKLGVARFNFLPILQRFTMDSCYRCVTNQIYPVFQFFSRFENWLEIK